MLERIDHYLTRKAAVRWPGALVVEQPGAGSFVLRRPDAPDVVLSSAPPTPKDRLFGVARESLAQAIAAAGKRP